MKVPSDDLAHEIWAAAQTAPGEGIEDAVERIAAIEADHNRMGELVKTHLKVFYDEKVDCLYVDCIDILPVL